MRVKENLHNLKTWDGKTSGTYLLQYKTVGIKENRQVIEMSSLADFYGDPLGARTQDPNIKSVVLYQLS